MNTGEHILACLAEECDEVGQRAMKALRFGLHEVQEGQTLNNAERIALELTDLLGVVQILESRGDIKVDRSPEAMLRKEARILKYMRYAAKSGALV